MRAADRWPIGRCRLSVGFGPLAASFVLVLLAVGPAAGRLRADEATFNRLVGSAAQALQEAEGHFFAGRRRPAADAARRARTLIEQADRLRPGDLTTALMALQAGVFQGDPAGARLWLGRYTRRTPYGEKDANLHYARALVWFFLEDRPDRAAEGLRRIHEQGAVRRGPHQDLLYYLALMEDGSRLTRGRLEEEALDRFQRAARTARGLRQARKETAARANAGMVLQQAGRPAESEAVFAALHREAPGNPLWSWYLGRSLVLQERFAEAIEHFGSVQETLASGRVAPPHDDLLVRAWLESGRCHREIARRSVADATRRQAALATARAALHRFTELAPKVAEGWSRLGRMLYEDLDESRAAMGPLEKAYELDPACDGSLRLLIRIATRIGPEPVDDPALMAERVEAWEARRKAWEGEMETNAEAWAAERERRRRESPDAWDGCP